MANLIHAHYIQEDELFYINYVNELLETVYKKYNITVLSKHDIYNMEYKFKIIFDANNIMCRIEYTCKEFHKHIYGKDLVKVIEQIENKIKFCENAKVEKVVTKSEDWKSMICPRCGGSIKRNKCEYCGTEFSNKNIVS